MKYPTAVQWPSRSLSFLPVSSAILASVLILTSSPSDVSIAIICGLGVAIVVYAARVHSARVVIFGTFLALLYAGSRDFAYLAIDVGPARVFVAELVLIAMWGSLVPQLIRRSPWPRTPLPVALWGYLAIGA